MPVLFSSTAELCEPSLYASAASRYIFLAMKMSPRISGVTRFVFGGGTTGACPVREPSRKSVCGDDGWAAARNAVRVKHAKLNDTKLNLETIVGLPEVHRLR